MDEFERVIRRQRGLFTRAQARAAGFSAYQVRRRLATGAWRVVLGQVLTERPGVVTAAIRDRAATLAIPGSVLVAASAARLFGMPTQDRTTYLWIGPLRRARLPGVQFRRDPLSTQEVTRFDGVPITDRPRTIVDCLRFLDDRAAVALLDRALLAGWITPPELAAKRNRLAGQRGATRLVRLIRLARGGARSEAERRALALLRDAGITGWVANKPIAGTTAVSDILFEDLKLVVEIDGWAYHSTGERFESDRQRQNGLVEAGWTVLRFTWRDLTERPDHVVASVRRIVGSRHRTSGRTA